MPGRSSSRSTKGSARSVAQRRRQAMITAVALVLIAAVFGITWLIDNSSGGSSDEQTRTVAVSTSSKTPTTKVRSSKSPSTKATSSKAATSKSKAAPTRSTSPKTTTPRPRSSATANAAVPAHVLRTLALIDAGEWPEAANAPGTKGGLTFRNNEGLLPRADRTGRRITYQEWDVNPKAPNRGRDAERIVTGSDGSAWYTADHYRTFVKIRGPS
ncbi:ribonuclease domain-containing protein [Gordonia paraffinivorans]|uniref:ribonuclease domain-containing protein n=1 Tax=Gordonia paraffinivorans TaxID=175628 RepID=UPI001FFB1868|nr:ribonuclease domain-containing protein [Gordonia paraffinivorans]